MSMFTPIKKLFVGVTAGVAMFLGVQSITLEPLYAQAAEGVITTPVNVSAASVGCAVTPKIAWYVKESRVKGTWSVSKDCPQITIDVQSPHFQWAGSIAAGRSGEIVLFDKKNAFSTNDTMSVRTFIDGQLLYDLLVTFSTDHGPSWVWLLLNGDTNTKQCAMFAGHHDPFGFFDFYAKDGNVLASYTYPLPDEDWKTPWLDISSNVSVFDAHALLSSQMVNNKPSGNIRADVWFKNVVNPCFDGTPGIELKKFTNGADADGANDLDVPQIEPTSIVTWTYLVTNTGNIAFGLAEVNVTDNQPGVHPVFVPASDDGDNVLSPGETWTYVATLPAEDLLHSTSGATIVPGCDPTNTGLLRPTYENIGTVVVRDLTDADPSHYCNVPHPDVEGQTDWWVEVWNPGNVDLKDAQLQLVDTKCQQVVGNLKAGQKVHIQCSGKLIVTATSVVGTVEDVFQMMDGIQDFQAPACTVNPAEEAIENVYLPLVSK